jgi:hypothetical protein
VTHEDLKVEFEKQAEWRWQKLAEYPSDQRNREAAERFEHLAKTTAHVPQHLLDAYYAAFSRWETERVVDVEAAVLREVGFHSAPESATEFVQNFLKRVADEFQAEPYRPRIIR